MHPVRVSGAQDRQVLSGKAELTQRTSVLCS